MSSSIPASNTNVYHVISTSGVQSLVNDLADLPTNPVSLFLNVERIKLGLNGRISKMILFVPHKSAVYIVDISRRGTLAFPQPVHTGKR